MPGLWEEAPLASPAPAPWVPARRLPPALLLLGSAGTSTSQTGQAAAPTPGATRACASQVGPGRHADSHMTTSERLCEQRSSIGAIRAAPCNCTSMCPASMGTPCLPHLLQCTISIQISCKPAQVIILFTSHQPVVHLLWQTTHQPNPCAIAYAVGSVCRSPAPGLQPSCTLADTCASVCCSWLPSWLRLQPNHQHLHPVQCWGGVSGWPGALPALPHWLGGCCWVGHLHAVQGRHLCARRQRIMCGL
jgi:hypothetical protein